MKAKKKDHRHDLPDIPGKFREDRPSGSRDIVRKPTAATKKQTNEQRKFITVIYLRLGVPRGYTETGKTFNCGFIY